MVDTCCTFGGEYPAFLIATFLKDAHPPGCTLEDDGKLYPSGVISSGPAGLEPEPVVAQRKASLAEWMSVFFRIGFASLELSRSNT